MCGRRAYASGSGHVHRPELGGEVDGNATKFVVTSGLRELEWQNSQRLTGDAAAAVSRLKERDGPLLQVHGSWQLIQTLLAHCAADKAA